MVVNGVKKNSDGVIKNMFFLPHFFKKIGGKKKHSHSRITANSE